MTKQEVAFEDLKDYVACGNLLRRRDASVEKPSPVLDAKEVLELANKEVARYRAALAHEMSVGLVEKAARLARSGLMTDEYLYWRELELKRPPTRDDMIAHLVEVMGTPDPTVPTETPQ